MEYNLNIENNLPKVRLDEETRNRLIAKSRKGRTYKGKKTNRWDNKSVCTVANTVKDYNKIDMDTFWKKDILKFDVKVEGETNTYLVTVEFNNILEKIQQAVKANNNLVDLKLIYKCLVSALNSTDIKFDCTCPDFKYRMAYNASQLGYKSGEAETRASDKTNPDDTLGAGCKHVLAVLNNAEWVRKVASVINNYINYAKEKLENLYSKYIFPKIYGMPYNKAVQLTIDNFDDDGELKDNLESSEEIINLSNALGKLRGRFKKGENKNPVTQERKKEKKEESLEESLEYNLEDYLTLNEDFNNPSDLHYHFKRHCEAAHSNQAIGALFSEKEIPNEQAYKEFAEWFVNQPSATSPRMKNNIWFDGTILTEEGSNIDKKYQSGETTDYQRYCPIKQSIVKGGKKVDLYLYAIYYYENNDKTTAPIIRTFFKCDADAVLHKTTREKDVNVKDYRRYKRYNRR